MLGESGREFSEGGHIDRTDSIVEGTFHLGECHQIVLVALHWLEELGQCERGLLYLLELCVVSLHALLLLTGRIVGGSVPKFEECLGIELTVVDSRLGVDDAADGTADVAARARRVGQRGAGCWWWR